MFLQVRDIVTSTRRITERSSKLHGHTVTHPPSWPAHSCKEPATSRISGLTKKRTTLPMIR